MKLSNNYRKMHGIPLWRKKDKRKRCHTRCEVMEVVEAFLMEMKGHIESEVKTK